MSCKTRPYSTTSCPSITQCLAALLAVGLLAGCAATGTRPPELMATAGELSGNLSAPRRAALLEASDSQDARQRANAAEAMLWQEDVEVARRLRELAYDPDPAVRASIAGNTVSSAFVILKEGQELTPAQIESAESVLLTLTTDDDPNVRIETGVALAHLNTPSSIRWAAGMLSGDSEPRVRAQVGRALIEVLASEADYRAGSRAAWDLRGPAERPLPGNVEAARDNVLNAVAEALQSDRGQYEMLTSAKFPLLPALKSTVHYSVRGVLLDSLRLRAAELASDIRGNGDLMDAVKHIAEMGSRWDAFAAKRLLNSISD